VAKINAENMAESAVQQDAIVANSAGKTSAKGSLIASLFTGIGASACCAGPLVLLTLGISGSWIGNLSKLEPFRPYFMGLALIFLALAFRKLYWLPKSCAVDMPCADTTVDRNQKIIFWIVSVVVIASIAFPWYGPFLLDD